MEWIRLFKYRRASGIWLGTRTGAGGTSTLTEFFFFWPQPMAPWTAGEPPRPFLIPSFALPDVLCDPTELI